MIPFVVRRMLQGVAALFVVSVAMFLLLFVGPNPLEQLRSNPEYSEADIARITEQYGWDRPWHVQYVEWAGGMLSGDWGDSLLQQRPAKELIGERLPLTLVLTSASLLLSAMIALPLGILLAARRNTRLDHGVAILSFALMAMPGFLLALGLQIAAIKLYHSTGILAAFAAGAPESASVIEWIRRLALPVIALTTVQVAGWTRYQRSETLGVLASEYVKVARAKGLSERTVMVRHALPNTALPIITIVAMDVATLFGGAVGVETIFGLPGMGSLMLDAVMQRDVVVALDIVVILATLMVVANLVADLLYGVFDPRARVAGSSA